MTSDLDKLLERAVLHIKHGTSGMCVAPQEIKELIEELREYRKMPRSGLSKDVLIDPSGWPDPCDLYAKTGFPKEEK